MSVQRIDVAGLRKSPVYAHVVKAGNTIYVAGQVAQDENGLVVGRGDITAQATQVFENLKRALQAAGADFSNVVKITIFLTDPRFREPLGKVRAQYIRDPLPASTLVTVAGLAEPDFLIEIEAVAVVE
jgi:reactive intermediate/imine deaminase